MNNQQSNQIIGLGVYTLQEAALYSSVSYQKLSRWLYGTKAISPIIKSQLYEQHLVSFLDLIQSKAISNARNLGISLQRIREAIDVLKRRYNIDFPLAHRFALVEFGGELHIQNHKEDKITQVTGGQKHQTLITKIVNQFIQDLEFNAQDVAEKYTPFVNNGITITFNPKVQFGQPIVGNTGYRADILNKAYFAENSYRSVADEFGVEIEEIKTAILYMNSLSKRAA